jgi:metallophosphoesterase (TIGR00282 family)
MHDKRECAVKTVRVLFIGDVVGVTGRDLFVKHKEALKNQYRPDVIVVNGENSSNHGRGITPKIAQFFLDQGVSVITTGNHVWYAQDIYPYLDGHTNVLRPANFPTGVPGVGISIISVLEYKVAIVNLQGRVFMKEHVDCPMRAADSIITYLSDKTKIILIDYHAEATSEKLALAYYLDGRISGLVGTHTHVQTADARILPKGTAYITDLGMVGSLNSMLGMKKEPVIHHFLTQLPAKFIVDDTSPFVLSGAYIEIDAQTGHGVAIERIYIVDEHGLQ